MANAWENLWKSVDKEKVEVLKRKLEQGNIQELLKNVDSQKAEQLLAQFGMNDKVPNGDVMRLLEMLKQNPALLRELRKLF